MYRAFGSQLAKLGSGDAKYTYGGKQLDDETNLYYFNARFFDAETGRFITEDPAKDGLNWYVYCGNNPLSYKDLTGLWVNFAIGAAVGFVSSTITETMGHYKSTGNLINDVGNALGKTFTGSVNCFVLLA